MRAELVMGDKESFYGVPSTANIYIQVKSGKTILHAFLKIIEMLNPLAIIPFERKINSN